MKNKRKVTTAIVAGVTAVALLLGGTFAWQSINQTALNEASDVINPGGRLHDDFDGTNKDVYVENFADEDIFARIQLSEYFAIVANYGSETAEKKTDIAGTATLTDGKITDPTYAIHYFGQTNATDEYWTWATGGSTVYMPTFNLNKDSLVADINGTYVDAIGGISNRDGDQYTGYTEYEVGDTETGTEIYDGDTNMDDEVGTDFENLGNYTDSIVTVDGVTHTAKDTLTTAGLISMEAWLAMVNTASGYDAATHGNYWVYDTDGWVYWSAPIAPDTATGLLLDGIALNGVMDDTWYYAINVVAQFVTADDVGKTDGTGFYATANGTVPTASAESLLGYIGVDMTVESTDSTESTKPTEPNEPVVLTLSASPADWDSQLNEGESVTLTVNGIYTADDLTWEWSNVGGANCNLQIVENEDGSATITHEEGGICAGNGLTLKVSLTNDPDVYLEMFVYGCEQAAPTIELTATTTDVNFTNEAKTNGVDLGLSATADGTEVALSELTFSVANNTSADTKVENGMLILGEDETAKTITVKAQYASATATVDVTVDYLKLAVWYGEDASFYNLDEVNVVVEDGGRFTYAGMSSRWIVALTHDGELLELPADSYTFAGDGTNGYVALEDANSNSSTYDDGHPYAWFWLSGGNQVTVTVNWEGRTGTFSFESEVTPD